MCQRSGAECEDRQKGLQVRITDLCQGCSARNNMSSMAVSCTICTIRFTVYSVKAKLKSALFHDFTGCEMVSSGWRILCNNKHGQVFMSHFWDEDKSKGPEDWIFVSLSASHCNQWGLTVQDIFICQLKHSWLVNLTDFYISLFVYALLFLTHCFEVGRAMWDKDKLWLAEDEALQNVFFWPLTFECCINIISQEELEKK